MEQVFSYIIGLGAAVMMPIIFTVLGLCIGIKFGDTLRSGLKVGVGFIGLSIVTALLTSALGPALAQWSISLTFSSRCLIWDGLLLRRWLTTLLSEHSSSLCVSE